jgi:hypothetical protein
MQTSGDSQKQSRFSKWLRSGSFIERWVKESLVTLPFAVPLAYVFLILKGGGLEVSYLNFGIGAVAVAIIVGFMSSRSSMQRYPEIKIDPQIARMTQPIEPK